MSDKIAGRELDAEVGKAMGWDRDSLGRIDEDEPAPYSTSISAAWRVVEKLGQLKLSHNPNDGLERCWRAAFSHSSYRNSWQFKYASTAPLAICLAALAAISAKPEGSK